MSFQFIIGRQHTNRKDYIYNQLVDWIQEDATGQVFYLVPDHIKFESEMNILEHIKHSPSRKSQQYAGMIDLQVFSFSRLAWYYLQDTALYSHSQLTETGLSMLVRRILREKEEQLTIYRGESRQQGFVEKLTALFMEMRNGRVEPEDLSAIMDQSQTSDSHPFDLDAKLHDLNLIYDAFIFQLQGKYIEREDVLEALIKEVKERDMSKTRIIIDNFHSFSAQEQALILTFAEHAQEVKVSLVLDKKYATNPPDLNDLFYEPGMTYFRLYQQLLEMNLPVLHDKVISEKSKEHCSEINELESYWVNSFKLTPQYTRNSSVNMDGCIEIREAETKQAEVLQVATNIKRMVADGNYRYKDILVTSRILEDYRTIIESTFEENDIELFVDDADTMAGHAIVEFIQSLLDIYKRNWRYTDIMRFLRTELFIPSIEEDSIPKERLERLHYFDAKSESWRKQVDILENVVLAYGYEGKDWKKDEDWIYARFHLEEMDEQLDSDKWMQDIANESKHQIRSVLLPFFKQLVKAETNQDAARLLYQFIERNGIHEHMLYWRDQALEEGDLDDARKHEQVWQTFIQLLDEFVDVLGDEEWDIDSFQTILETGFEQATYSIVPPSIDQVQFSSFDKSRINTKKVVFILGMTDTKLPMNLENDSILTDEDRESLKQVLPMDKYLAPTTSGLLASEPFAAYLAFMNASEKLIMSYPVRNDGAGDNRLSPYIDRIARYFSIPIQSHYAEASILRNEPVSSLYNYVGSRIHTMGQLVTVLRESLDLNHYPPLFWVLLYRSLVKDASPTEKRILNSLEYRNVPKPLPNELAEELYGKNLYLSVSQLESFYLDPYSHFLRYGLRLRERSIQELTPAETGNFFHDALDSVFQTIVKRDLTLNSLTDKQLNDITDEVLTSLYDKNKFRLLSVSNRMQFVRKQLSQTVRQMLWAMLNQSKRTKMTAQKSEVLFGRLAGKQGIPGLTFPLNNGGELHVRGKIDRLDTLELNNQLYLSVVDYKSSEKRLNFHELYHGLMLQLLTYLDTAVEFSEELFGKKARPAGAFYAHVKNPMLDGRNLKGKDPLLEMLKTFKMRGILLNEEDLLLAMDKTLEPKVVSMVYPLRQKADSSLSGDFILLEDLELLLKHQRDKIREAGNLILSGENRLAPIYDKKRFTPSVGGEYQSISQFDVLLPDNQNQYRKLTPVKDQSDLINKLKGKYDLLGKEEE